MLRHHASDASFGAQVAALCEKGGLTLAVAGDVGLARAIGAAMVHNPTGDAAGLLVSRSVHSRKEAIAARGADLIFVSPLHASASHQGAEPLGFDGALALARVSGVPAIALGGMDPARGRRAMAAGFYGWAAIDAWR